MSQKVWKIGRYFVTFSEYLYFSMIVSIYVKIMFSKDTKIDEIFTSIWHYEVGVKSTVKIFSMFVAFLENKNFM